MPRKFSHCRGLTRTPCGKTHGCKRTKKNIRRAYCRLKHRVGYNKRSSSTRRWK